MDQENLHQNYHDNPQKEPAYAFPPEFPSPGEGLTGPFVIVDEFDCHEGTHPPKKQAE